MTFKEYNDVMKLVNELSDPNDQTQETIDEFKEKYMKQLLNDYKETVDSPAKECIYELFYYAVYESETGQSIVEIPKEIVEEVEEIYWYEIGDYLLDGYVYEKNEKWYLDCMFGGNYVPYWEE